MDVMTAALKGLRPLLNRAIRRSLSDRLSTGELEQTIRQSWTNYEAQARHLPAEPSFGARVMVRLAAATMGIDEALREAGLDEQEARERTSKITWLVYQKLVVIPWKGTRLLAKKRVVRVRRMMDWLMRFPYSAPGYRIRYVGEEQNRVDFDVHRCPVAEYFAARGRSALCASSFCNLDYPLARQWGVELTRVRTIAEGASRCDFRFRSVSRGERPGA